MSHALSPGRRAWVQVARGALTLDGLRLSAGDGAAIDGMTAIALSGIEPADILLFDLA